MKKKENPLSVYATVSQLAFVIISPLLIFIVGGYYLTSNGDYPEWVMPLCVVLGLVFMIGGAASYLGQLIKRYGKDEKDKPMSFNSRSDNDYYDDYKGLRK